MSNTLREIKPSHRQYGLSTANELHPLTAHLIARKPIASYVQTAKESGYDGIEVWPMNPWLSSQIALSNLFDGGLGVKQTDILSAHQSPRQENWRDIPARKLAILPQLLMLPGMTGSLKYLEALSKWKPELSVVMYEQTPTKKIDTELLHRRLVQIRKETIEQWQVTDLSHLIEKMYVHGFTGICFDWAHFKRASFGDWKQVIPQLMQRKLLKEVHLSVGRTDLGKDITPGSVQDLQDLMKVVEESEILAFLRLLNSVGYQGPIIVELMPSAVKASRSEKQINRSPLVSQDEMRNTYDKIRVALYHCFEGPLAG